MGDTTGEEEQQSQARRRLKGSMRLLLLYGTSVLA